MVSYSIQTLYNKIDTNSCSCEWTENKESILKKSIKKLFVCGKRVTKKGAFPRRTELIIIHFVFHIFQFASGAPKCVSELNFLISRLGERQVMSRPMIYGKYFGQLLWKRWHTRTHRIMSRVVLVSGISINILRNLFFSENLFTWKSILYFHKFTFFTVYINEAMSSD